MKKFVIVLFVFASVPLTVFAQAQGVFNNDLRYGMSNKIDVAQLQEFLADEGLYVGPITGNFFSLTLKAVKAFQLREGILPAAGYFGPKTRVRANVLLGAQISDSNQQAKTEIGQNAQPSTGSSEQSTQSQLDALLKQITLLQEQLKTKQQTSTGASASPSTTPAISINITPSSGASNTSANTYVSAPPQNAVFYEDFSGTFPGNKWIVSSQNFGYNQPSPQIDANIGSNPPSLAVPFSSGESNFILLGKKITADANPFNSSDGFTVSVDVRQPDTSPETNGNYSSSGWVRSFKFEIKNMTNQYAYASFEIRPDAELIDYSIYRAYVGGGGSFISAPYGQNADFHTFKFTVDEYGNAKWFRDGIMKNSFGGFPVGDYIISFSASGRNLPVGSASTASYSHSVDNIAVTIP